MFSWLKRILKVMRKVNVHVSQRNKENAKFSEIFFEYQITILWRKAYFSLLEIFFPQPLSQSENQAEPRGWTQYMCHRAWKWWKGNANKHCQTAKSIFSAYQWNNSILGTLNICNRRAHTTVKPIVVLSVCNSWICNWD